MHDNAIEAVPGVDESACRLRNALPLCPRCGALARPNVLMFGALQGLTLIAARFDGRAPRHGA
jgi:hypothetical protein